MPSLPIVKQSRYPYAETIARLSAAILNGGNVLFATIDQSAAARAAGLDLRPTSLLIFGNPKGGTPVMAAFPLAALRLPLKLLVWEDSGQANVAYFPMSALLEDDGLPAGDLRAAAMDRALESLSASVT